MSFNGTEGEQITLEQGSRLTNEYRIQNPGETLAHFFGRDIINTILTQENCAGIRMYYGINPDTQTKELVLVGADENENDLIDGIIADVSVPCPTRCSVANALNR